MGYGDLRDLRRPFTVAEAAAAGVNRKALGRRRYRRILPGIYTLAECEPTVTGLVEALRVGLEPPVIFDGLTALQLRGLDLGGLLPVRIATQWPRVVRRRGIGARADS